jgi:predicted ATPase/class 3 adenylate cyclase
VDELPEGTVNFLFSDVEGSTRLLERFGDRLTAALVAHHELLARAVAEEDGVVFETVGDAVYAAFAEPLACARAAVAAQRAMLTYDWGALGDVRIRIALHRGPVERRGAHYVGPPLFRAARLLGLAHGGQTLVSGDMADALAAGALAAGAPAADALAAGAPVGTLPAGLTVRDLGRHRLKDLVEAELVHQLDAPGLPSTFPPLRSSGARFDNLPRPASTFVGRERELAEVASALETGRLVSLLGPGGSGKTRLALEVAARTAGGFGDGVAFVDLAAVGDASLVGATVAATLGVRPIGDEPAEQAVARWLRDRELLLVVDNLEQIIDGAPVLARLLEAAPAVRVLATSRERLRLRGERPIMVGPLDAASTADGLSACVRLFCDRAGLDPERLPAETAAAIESLGQRLDGLPLAIELAAARAGVLPPTLMLERLGHGGVDLAGGDRDLPVRQRTLRTTIDWSLDLLSSSETRSFVALGVFAGGWSLAAAETVCGDPADRSGIVDGLATLVDKSLVGVDPPDPFGRPRYRFLETIRGVAVERLAESDLRGDLERRHVAWIVDLAEQAEPELLGADAAAWLNCLLAELPNIRLAMDRAIGTGDGRAARRIAGALAHFWWRSGLMREGRDIARRALAAAPVEDQRLEARACLAAVESAQQLGLLDEAEPLVEQAIGVLEPLGPSRDLATALHDRGVIAAYRRHLDEAVEAFGRALRVWDAIGDVLGRSGTIQSIGLAQAVIEGDVAAAEPWTADAYEVTRDLADPFTRSEAASARAEILLLLARYGEAADALTAAVRDVRAAGLPDPLLAAQVIGQLGMLAAGIGTDDDAARLHGFCVSRHAELIGRPAWLASQWAPLEDALGERLGLAIRDALMADGAGLTTEAAFELGLAHARRVEAEGKRDSAAALPP